MHMKRKTKWAAAAICCLLLFSAGFVAIRTGVLFSGGHAAGETQKTVIIDPGHGGADGGAVSADGTVEKGINLDISLKLRDFLEAYGYRVIMTRDTDISIHDPSAKSIREQKVSDLHNRLKIAEENPDAIFVSIHQNKFEVPKYCGTQTFFSPNNPQSTELAKIIQGNIRGQLQPENAREVKKVGKEIYTLYHMKQTSVMVECGFLSNPEEAKKLVQPEYQDQLAFLIATSVAQYDASLITQ